MKKWIAMFVFCFCLIGAGQITVYAKSVQVTGENGQNKLYESDIQNLVINGEKKDLGQAPGIVVENEVMLTHTAVFKKMLGMKVSYNGKEGSVTLTTKEHTMKFTKNSKIALLDGQEKQLRVAPVWAKYLDTGVSTILLPATEIAQVWGYDFSHRPEKQEVSFFKKSVLDLTYAGLSFHYMGSTVVIKTDYDELDYRMPGLIVDHYTMIPIRAVAEKMGVKYSYSSSKKQITLTKGEQKVVLTMNKKTATVNGEAVELPIAPAYVKNNKIDMGCNMVPAEMVAEMLMIGYEWDEETKTIHFVSPSDYQISMKLPEECLDGNYSIEDDYFNNRFHILFDGNYKNFFIKNGIKNKYSVVEDISVTEKEDITTITLQANKIKGYEIKEEDGILYVKVGTPKEIYDKIVVLDAGHGGTDPGAAGNGIYEKNVTLSILNAARNYFNLDEDIKVYYTRTTNTQKNITSGSNGLSTSSSLAARTKFANNIGADLFISIHINSASNKSARGTEVYYSKNNNKTNSSRLNSQKLANIAYNYMLDAVGSTKRGVKTANFYVVNHTNMPAILIETAFISNKADASILKNSKKIDAMGEAIYNTVCETFANYPTKR